MKNKRSNQVLGVLKGVYNRIEYIRKKKRLRKYKRNSSRLQKKNKYRSKKVEKDRDVERMRLQKKRSCQKNIQ